MPVLSPSVMLLGQTMAAVFLEWQTGGIVKGGAEEVSGFLNFPEYGGSNASYNASSNILGVSQMPEKIEYIHSSVRRNEVSSISDLGASILRVCPHSYPWMRTNFSFQFC